MKKINPKRNPSKTLKRKKSCHVLSPFLDLCHSTFLGCLSFHNFSSLYIQTKRNALTMFVKIGHYYCKKNDQKKN